MDHEVVAAPLPFKPAPSVVKKVSGAHCLPASSTAKLHVNKCSSAPPYLSGRARYLAYKTTWERHLLVDVTERLLERFDLGQRFRAGCICTPALRGAHGAETERVGLGHCRPATRLRKRVIFADVTEHPLERFDTLPRKVVLLQDCSRSARTSRTSGVG